MMRYNARMFPSANIADTTIIVFSYLLKLWPFWVAPIMLKAFWELWISHVRGRYIDSEVEKAVVLEIRFPQEVTKTPLSMEIVIQALWQIGGEATWFNRYWEGKVRQWFSLEMVSLGGAVHFYIWTPAKMKATIEQQFYSQFPGIEVFEVPDYSHYIDFEKGKTDASVLEYDLLKPSPIPIKTYIDYGLDKQGQEEEYKTDPLTPIIEYLGSLREGEQAWIQILIRAHRKETVAYVKGKKKLVNWEHAALAEIQKMRDAVAPEKEGESERRMTKGEQEMVYAIERNIMKMPFDVGIRSIYIAPIDKYNPGNAGSLKGIFQVFGSATLNGFGPAKRGTGGTYTYPWQETEARMTRIKKEFLKVYRLRAYFHPPYRHSLGYLPRPLNVLNTEALATIFHIPGSVAQTPSMGRVLSKKSEAPSNLPI